LGSLKELQLGPTSTKEQDILNALTSLGFDENHVLDLLREEDYSEVQLEESIKRLIQKMGKV
jgi:Holliday junction resolvasome RuvABC DNA-binding subunit